MENLYVLFKSAITRGAEHLLDQTRSTLVQLLPSDSGEPIAAGWQHSLTTSSSRPVLNQYGTTAVICGCCPSVLRKEKERKKIPKGMEGRAGARAGAPLQPGSGLCLRAAVRG